MKLLFKIVLPLVIILAAFGLSKVLVSTKPETQTKRPPVIIPQVDVITVKQQDHQSPVLSYGTVQSYFETNITAQVSAKIVAIYDAFQVGVAVKKGTILAKLDPTDFEVALAQQKANLTVAKRTLAEEKIRAKQAAEDWLASGRKLSSASDFVLRKPQLAAAQADIDSIGAAVEKAQADLDRTILRAPFEAIVSARSASLGNFATPQVTLGSLVATERAEVRLPLTAEQATRVLPPAQGNTLSQAIDITLTNPSLPDHQWPAKLTRVEPLLDAQSQVLYVIAEINRPFTATKHPLSIGTFVNATIPGKTISAAYKIPEAALINDAYIWGLDKENKLMRLPVSRLHSDKAHAFVRLQQEPSASSLRIVSRPLTNFRQGMEVRPLGREKTSQPEAN